MASALELRHVSAGYGETVVIEDIDLKLAPGECISVIGRNGVGKTTLLSTIMGHTTLHSGEVMLDGQTLNGMPSYRRALAGLGFVPQEREIFPSLTVRENLDIGARPGHWTLPRVFELFPRLQERLGNMGNQLSGGEQQMLSIARALLTNPEVLLMDEPTEGLAPVLVDTLIDVLAKLRAESALSIILVEQNSRVALRLLAAHRDPRQGPHRLRRRIRAAARRSGAPGEADRDRGVTSSLPLWGRAGRGSARLAQASPLDRHLARSARPSPYRGRKDYACALRCGSMIFSSLPSTCMHGSSWARLAFGSRFSRMAAMNSRSSSSMPSIDTSTFETSILLSLPSLRSS